MAPEAANDLPATLQKEQFSRAFVGAVVAAAGYATSRPDPDVDKIDLTVHARGARGSVRSPRIDIQLKCTAADDGSGEEVVYDLDVETYDALRQDGYAVPRYLVIVAVPPDPRAWLRESEHELALRRCAYWADLAGRAPAPGDQRVRVRVPRRQQLTVDSLRALLDAAGQE